MKTNLFIKKLDIILIFALVFLAFSLYFPKLLDKGELLAHIYIDNKEYNVIDLMQIEEEFEISLPCEPPLVLRGGKGYIFVHEAHCPDKLCVSTGRLAKSGDMAVCIPARVVIKLESKSSESEFDAIAY